MSTDDEAARKARAEKLRVQIEELKKGPARSQKPEAPGRGAKSYRDLIHEKMNELDKQK
jgi:hypothetical protein